MATINSSSIFVDARLTASQGGREFTTITAESLQERLFEVKQRHTMFYKECILAASKDTREGDDEHMGKLMEAIEPISQANDYVREVLFDEIQEFIRLLESYASLDEKDPKKEALLGFFGWWVDAKYGFGMLESSLTKYEGIAEETILTKTLRELRAMEGLLKKAWNRVVTK